MKDNANSPTPRARTGFQVEILCPAMYEVEGKKTHWEGTCAWCSCLQWSARSLL